MNFEYTLEIVSIEGISSDKRTVLRISAHTFRDDFIAVVEEERLTDIYTLKGKGSEITLSGRKLISDGKLPINEFSIEFGIIKNILRYEKYIPQDRRPLHRGPYCPFKDNKNFSCEGGKVMFTAIIDTGRTTQVRKTCQFSKRCKLDLKK